MRIVVACSESWFSLKESLESIVEVFFISEPSELTRDFLAKINPRYVFFPHWNKIVSDNIYCNFECVAFHTAPLPYGRGGSPIQNLIVEGVIHAPVCALKMTSEVDGGPIYSKKEISLTGSLSDIFSRINNAVNELMLEIICGNPSLKEQTGDVRVFKRRKGTDNLIPPELTLNQVYDRIRMLDAEGYPRAYLETSNYRVEFDSACVDGDAVCSNARITLCK